MRGALVVRDHPRKGVHMNMALLDQKLVRSRTGDARDKRACLSTASCQEADAEN